jgi:copper chaperone CopZ
MTKTIKIGVGGMTCNHCAMNVKNALSTLEGVESVTIHLMEEEATVITRASLDKKTVQDVLQQAGYSLTNLE